MLRKRKRTQKKLVQDIMFVFRDVDHLAEHDKMKACLQKDPPIKVISMEVQYVQGNERR